MADADRQMLEQREEDVVGGWVGGWWDTRKGRGRGGIRLIDSQMSRDAKQRGRGGAEMKR